MGRHAGVTAATPAVYKVRPERDGSGCYFGAEAARDTEESALALVDTAIRLAPVVPSQRINNDYGRLTD